MDTAEDSTGLSSAVPVLRTEKMTDSEYHALVRARVLEMSEEDMRLLLMEIADEQPADRQDAFLRRLGVDAQKTRRELSDEKDHVLGEIGHIAAGEYTVKSRVNEDYDDWYRPFEPEILYDDENGAFPKIRHALDYVCRCIPFGLLEEAYEVSLELAPLYVFDDGEYRHDLSVQELCDNEIIDFDFTKYRLAAARAALECAEKESREQEIYDALTQGNPHPRKMLDEFFTTGPVFRDTGEFLTSWIRFLTTRKDSAAADLLDEAVDYLDDPEKLAFCARSFGDVHPMLYLKWIDACDGDEEILSAAQEALQAIPVDFTIRAQAAERAIAAAKRLQRPPEEILSLTLEAFASETTVSNLFSYLLLLMELDPEGCRERALSSVREVLSHTEKDEGDHGDEPWERQKNRLYCFSRLLIQFLTGDFDSVLGEDLEKKEVQSSSFLSWELGRACGLLLLYPDGVPCGKGLAATVKREAVRPWYDKDGETFLTSFLAWKKHLSLPAKQQEILLRILGQDIFQEMERIVGVRRKQYDRCAAWIAALGEVREARNQPGALQETLQEAYAAHSGARRFVEALERYGLKR